MFKRKRYKNKSPRLTRQQGSIPDYVLLGVLSFLTLFGWVMVYSSSVIVAFSQNKPSWYYFLKQFAWIILGCICGYILYRIDYRVLIKISPILITIGIIMLVAVLFIGKVVNGSARWINLSFFDLQPSEFVKLAFILYLSGWLSRKNKPKRYQSPVKNYLYIEMLPFLGILATILILVLIEPDLGTTAVIGLTALVLFFLSGEGYLHNIGFSLLLITSTLVGGLAALLESYRISRIKTFLQVIKTGMPPDRSVSGYQLSQILIAIGSGGFLGVGFGQSKQKFNYLGETAFSDNIFAVIAEEFGFLGAIFIATVFLFIALRGIKIVQQCPDRQTALLAAGITVWFTVQAFFHIAANVGLIPLTGITLPFVSYGGSSMIVTLSAAGILLNISKYVKLN